MKTELIDVSPTRKEVRIEIDADAVRSAYDSISDRYAKSATVPGFRPGHAPRSVVRSRYKKEIRGEVLRELVPPAVTEAIAEHDLNVIGEPDVHLDDAEGPANLSEQPITLHATLEVLPELELGQYRGIEATRRVRPVKDEDIERVIEGLREASASLQPVEDRGAQLGDTVTANFHGQFVQTPEAEDINAEEVEVVLGGEGVQQEFTDHLMGARPDDQRAFTVNYPEDFTAQGLAGKEVAYTAEVTAVRLKELPELDDEWAKSLGEEYDSVATLRERVREDLSRRASFEAETRLRNEVVKKLVAAHQFEVPPTLIEHQTNQRFESLVHDLLGHGVNPALKDVDWRGMREGLKGVASDDVRASLLLERIAEQEQIEVTDEEIQAEIAAIVAATRQTPEQVRAALTKQGGERSIADRLRSRKATDLIVENAHVTDEEWREESSAESTETVAAETAAAVTPTEPQPSEESSEAATGSSATGD